MVVSVIEASEAGGCWSGIIPVDVVGPAVRAEVRAGRIRMPWVTPRTQQQVVA